jgi:23S rRNA (pseudouridine1915-N3)-methyltransferase
LKLLLIFVGRTQEEYLNEGIEEYLERISRYAKIDVLVVKNSAQKIPDKAMKEEEINIVSKISPGDYMVIMDERGSEINSRKFSDLMQKWIPQGKGRIVFIIGGAFGISPDLKAKAKYVLSMSKFTFTHQMVRLFLVEQIYRALTISRNEKYHHD